MLRIHRPTFIRQSPSGQGLVEALVVLFAIGLMLSGLTAVSGLVQSRMELIEAARFVGERCRVSAASCHESQRSGDVFLQQIADPNSPVSSRSGGNSRARDSRLVVSFDSPVASISGQSALGKIQLSSMGYLMEVGGDLFGLPDARRLRRVRIERQLETQWGQILQSERLASLADTWTAQAREQAQSRIDRGSRPAELIEEAVRLGQAPAVDLLLPTFEAVGLESGAARFRADFKRGDWMRPFGHPNR